MKILNLYAGIGGNRKLWGDEHEITAIENNKEIAAIYKDYFPNDTVIVTDAHQYLLDHYKEFDFIWSSPPCQSHSRMIISGTNRKKTIYPDMKLYQEIIFLNQFFKGKYVIENVIPYYKPLIIPQLLDRHSYWANFTIGKFKEPKKQTDLNNMKKRDLCNWLGFPINIPNIYIDGNHCNIQILRNCVHPETGKYILDRAMNIIRKENINQTELF
jgi:DNA (cytosine-5)-methyltransferase 1